ncbi:MAG: hypothetical protein H0W10_02220 [Chloroflexi bacterium]|nr:hypothetical protein [Chloroflexota bacterium]
MDFSKLDQNEKLAVYGASAVVLAGLISTWGGLLWLAILAAVGMLAVVLLPQISNGTSLPGSQGTLMAALGFVALGAGLIEVLRYLGFIGSTLGSLNTIAFIVAVIGAAIMAYAGWREIQMEGGKWVFGRRAGAASAPAPASRAESANPPPSDVDEHRSPEA